MNADSSTRLVVTMAHVPDGKLSSWGQTPGSQASDCIVVDPMLATGNSAVAAVTRIKASNPRSIKFVCLLTCPEGLAVFTAAHPDIRVYTASIDERLNEKSYIVRGLGEAGDRLFGTK